MRKKRLINCKSGDESLLRSKTKVRVESELFKEFLVEFGAHQESVFSPRRLKLQWNYHGKSKKKIMNAIFL